MMQQCNWNWGDAERPPPSHITPVLGWWVQLPPREGRGAPARPPPPRPGNLVSQRKLDVDKTVFFSPKQVCSSWKIFGFKQLFMQTAGRKQPVQEKPRTGAAGTGRRGPLGADPFPIPGQCKHHPVRPVSWRKRFNFGSQRGQRGEVVVSRAVSAVELLTPVHRDDARCLHHGYRRDLHPPSSLGLMTLCPSHGETGLGVSRNLALVMW